MRILVAALCLFGLASPAFAQAELLRSFLPSSRNVHVGEWGTVFMALTNSGQEDLTQCAIGMSANPLRPSPDIDVIEIDTNGAIIEGTRYQVFDMARGQTRHFLIGLRPNAGDFNDEFLGTGDIVEYGQWVVAGCSGTFAQESDVARLDFTGFSGRQPPDILPVIVTPSGDGIVHIDGETQRGIAAVAAINLGEPADLVFNVDAMADLDIRACQTDTKGTCMAPRTNAIPFRLETNETALFSIIAVDRIASTTPNLPGQVRLWVNFDEVTTSDIGARSTTSVAINDRYSGAPLRIRTTGQYRTTNRTGDALILRGGRYFYYRYQYEYGRIAGMSIHSIGSYGFRANDTLGYDLLVTPDAGYEDAPLIGGRLDIRTNSMTLVDAPGVTQRAVYVDSDLPDPVYGEFVGLNDLRYYQSPFPEGLPRLNVEANGTISGAFVDDWDAFRTTGRTCTISGSDGGDVTLTGCSMPGSGYSALIYLVEDSLDSSRTVMAILRLSNGSETHDIALYSPNLR